VTAVTLRGDLRVETHRRSEIGSHTPPQSAIFIDLGDLRKVMGHSLLKIVIVLDREPFDYDAENEDEYDPLGFSRVTAFSGGEL